MQGFCNIDRARRELGFRPVVDLRESMRRRSNGAWTMTSKFEVIKRPEGLARTNAPNAAHPLLLFPEDCCEGPLAW
jgi:hypothetical protein